MSSRSRIKSVKDIEALEKVPLDRRLEGCCTSYDVIQRAAETFPDKPAITFLPEGNADEQPVEISYEMLFRRVNQTANMFHDLGIGANDVVSYILPNLPETHYVLWGGEAAGIVNPINPLMEVEHMAGIMNAAKTKILVTLGSIPDSDIWQKVEHIRKLVPSLRHVITLMGQTDGSLETLSYHGIIDQYNDRQLDSGRIIDRDDICSLFHTGGTTGTPKLARHSHYNEVTDSYIIGLIAEITDQDVGLCGLPMFHVNAPIVTGLSCFMVGASVILAGIHGFRSLRLIADFWKICEKYKVTIFSGVPTVYSTLLHIPVAETDLSSLRMAICGAAPMPRELIRKFEKTTGLILLEGYGLTEGACVSSCNPLFGPRKVGSIGLRIPYQEMKTVILDGQGKYIRDCAVDEIGHVVIRGPNVMPGYLQEEPRRKSWIADNWFNTGDMGREDEDGYFWLTGRAKELIIRGGHNIDPAVIENALLEHNAVREVAAVGKPDAHAGELPVAYVVLSRDATCREADLIEFAKEHIAERAARPKNIYIIEALPLTAVGKIFKPALKRDAIKRVIEQDLFKLNMKLNITVEADKTYGTVAIIETEFKLSKKISNQIQNILGQYAFQTRIQTKNQ